MNEENENKLVQDFPILYNGAEPYKNPADKIWKLLKNGPNPREVMHGGFSCGDGWFDILYELSAELYKLDEIPTVLQVKEKFGTLSYYVGFATDGVYDIIDKETIVFLHDWAINMGRCHYRTVLEKYYIVEEIDDIGTGIVALKKR